MNTEHSVLVTLSAPPGAQGAARWRIGSRPMVLGRHPGCEIHLPARQISREHARIFATATGYFVEDLGSKNGTFVNGEPATRPLPLRDGDVLQIGLAYRLSFIGAEGTVPLPDRGDGGFAIEVEVERKEVRVGGDALSPPLSPAQFELLELLMNADGGIVTRDEIARRIWGSEEGVTEQAIDALVRRLRRRLAEADPERTWIVTVRGYGFRLDH